MRASSSACSAGAIGSLRPLPISTATSDRSGRGSGRSGTIAPSSTAPRRLPGRVSSIPPAMLAPLEKPIATTLSRSKPYLTAASSTKSASSPARRTRSSVSNTPSACRANHRGIPRSRTWPRGLSTPAPGAIRRASGSRSCSSAPVPCRASTVGSPDRSGGTQMCRKSVGSAIAGLPVLRPVALRNLEGWQHRLDVLTLGLQPRRQPQGTAQLKQRFVDGEPGRIGGDLQEHAAGLAEVDGAEVVAVDDRRDVIAVLDDLLAPCLLRLVVGRAPGDMVHGAGGHQAPRRLGLADHVDDLAGCSVADREAEPLAGPLGQREAQRVDQQPGRGLEAVLGERDRVEAADGLLGRNGPFLPGRALGRPGVCLLYTSP